MRRDSITQKLTNPPDHATSSLQLTDGSNVAIVGGGPAGSYFAYFLLSMADMIDLELQVDVYEPRNFLTPGPKSCNMCGGILSESLVQMLATEGINLPGTVVQRGVDSYVLHMDAGSVRIETPLREMRIGAIHRGAGPRGSKGNKWQSFDGYLQGLTVQKGARIIQERVSEISWNEGRPQIRTRQGTQETYDLLLAAVGVNSATLKLFNSLHLAYQPPKVTRTVIREYRLGAETIARTLGNSMHVFLLDIPRLDFAAIIPKGDYATVCLLGEDIDQSLFESFLNAPEVKNCMPPGWQMKEFACQCAPRMNVNGASQPYGDRIAFIGDCGSNRLNKDGIGGAHRTAKAAATTAVFHGIAAEDFHHYYRPACQAIDRDNQFGHLIFSVTHLFQRLPLARRAILNQISAEQNLTANDRRMSMVMWDMFTGSAPYRDIFRRTLHPLFLVGLISAVGRSILSTSRSRERGKH